ncbi:hypothetical protein X777_03751 [Ooceraea biroi]|uniref:GIY-YIG domain-containing protein n=1 Tax=Ooceraea biroi TaxID=2015173 RepID=A0A026X454_OOCBI|nr:hypothetical protein X777_03751 [Ooceraea biroi]
MSSNHHINKITDRKDFITLPYIRNLSENIKRILRGVGFRVLYTILKKLDRIIKRGKDLLPNNKQTNVVYRLNCLHCDACYVGQTKRHVETRVKEHKSDVRRIVGNHSVVSKHRLIG